MHMRELGSSAIRASVVGLGTWAIGGWMWGGTDRAESIRAIQAAIDAGMNLIDTAPVYGFGASEEIVGEAIRGRRDEVVLATKCGLIWHEEVGQFFFESDEQTRADGGHLRIHKCLRPEMIRYEVEQSLLRLKVDYIDLYQTHWQDPTTPIADTVGTLVELEREGKIRAFGCSNATPAQMAEYRAGGDLDSDQELYSMLDRGPEATNLPDCSAHHTAFLAYSPLAQGLLTGKIGPDRLFPVGDQRRTKPRFSSANRAKAAALLAEITPIADAHSLSLGQLAIAWAVAQPGCTHALVGARSPGQVLENAAAGRANLTPVNLAAIDRALRTHDVQ